MKLPEDKHNTRRAIFKGLETLNDGGLRSHLGASIIGRDCARSLWYTFRWATYLIHSGRLLRLFRRGQLEEASIEHDLKMAHIKVFTEDENGEQFRFEKFGGHFGGSCDGIAASGIPESPKTPHIIEMKTHNDKSFKDLVKKASVKEAKFEHFVQMQIYMGLSGEKWGDENKIRRALYISVNKNDDDIYVERVEFDKDVFKEKIELAERIIFHDKAPARISEDPTYYKCKFCDHYDVCHLDAIPYPSCRSCCYASAEKDGTWSCEKFGETLTKEKQLKGCKHHLINPSMVDSSLNAVDGDDDHIVFEKKGTTQTFKNGAKYITTKYAFGLDVKDFLFNENIQQMAENFSFKEINGTNVEDE